MRLRKLLSDGALVSGGVLGIGLPIVSAQAAGACTLSVPSTIRIATQYQSVTGRLGADCTSAGTVYAEWDLYRASGLAVANGRMLFSSSTTAVWNARDSDIQTGVLTWRPAGAHDVNQAGVTQNQPITDVRVGSGAAIYISRSGSTVTIRTSSSRYAYSLHQWVRWGNITGVIQYYSTSGVWTSMKNAYQDSSGYYTYRLTSPYARSYRVVFPSTGSIWGSTSASVSVTAAPITPRAYANCIDLNAVYPHGVGRTSSAMDHTTGVPVTDFFVSAPVYDLNTGRDADHDYIACERH